MAVFELLLTGNTQQVRITNINPLRLPELITFIRSENGTLKLQDSEKIEFTVDDPVKIVALLYSKKIL